MASLILTVIGDDRPGLVSDLSAPISAQGANWERSRMSRLAGKFAGIVQLSVAEERLATLLEQLAALADQGIHVTHERTDTPRDQEAVELRLELLGADHPGIVAEISASFAGRGVSIEELDTDFVDAPMAGGKLFQAQAVLSAPPSTDVDELRSVLEALADDLMVDIKLSTD
jgi:glycine cleavage system regulatory protein